LGCGRSTRLLPRLALARSEDKIQLRQCSLLDDGILVRLCSVSACVQDFLRDLEELAAGVEDEQETKIQTNASMDDGL
jgi:hypothetical protein